MDLDILALTETFLKEDELENQKVYGELVPPGYKIHHVPRANGNGRARGGVAVICRDLFKQTHKPSFQATSFESMEVAISAKSSTIKLIVIYRVPPNKTNKIKRSTFHAEFSKLLEKVAIEPGKLLIVGDLNVHWDEKNATETRDFETLLSSFNLQQSVEESTHRHGHILDWVISRPQDNLVKSCSVDSMISDHHAVVVHLECSRPHPQKKSKTYRNIRAIDPDTFRNDILKSDLITHPKICVEDKVKQYNEVLTEILNKHAPEKVKMVAVKDNRPWMNEKIRNAKKKRRKFEKQWRKTKLTVHREAYVAEREAVKKLIETEKAAFYNEKIHECEGDQKKLFSIIDKLLNRGSSSKLPQHDNPEDLVNEFSDFFDNKIKTIRRDLADLEHSSRPVSCPPMKDILPPNKNELHNFEPATEKEVLQIIKASSKASCSLDPIPTHFLVDHLLPVLLPVITDIVNASLSSGIFPELMKIALIKPLLKKITLNPELCKNFRPVSNLSFLSKIVEKVVAARLIHHMSVNGLHDKMQSAYKQFHSTETALLKVKDDILKAMDNTSGIYLALIDLSAAFDTVDHDILLNFLQEHIGICGTAWNWFKTYLTGRTQQVSIDGIVSNLAELLYGVPQGSVLGPIKYCVYTLPIGAIIRHHGLKYTIYADDTQVYLTFDKNCIDTSLQKLNDCLSDIRAWMLKSKLKINDDKTEFLLISSSRLQAKLHRDQELTVGSQHIPISPLARNLGVVFDCNMRMDKHVTNVCKSANFHLRNIGSIRSVLSESAAAQLVHALITSRLDYCNSLLYGLPDSQIKRLQQVQNNAARMVGRVRKFDHITPTLKRLHWLPVRSRINFKMNLMTYKTLNGKSPEYICDLLKLKRCPRSIRNSDEKLLHVPKFRCNTLGGTCFSVGAPTEWNKLPQSIRYSASTESFKKALKTHLFSGAFK